MKISKIKIVRLPLEVSNTQKHKLFYKDGNILCFFTSSVFTKHVSISNLRGVCIFALCYVTKKHGTIGSLACSD